MPEQFFVRLLGTRDGWPDDMTPSEQQIMGAHFEFLKELARQGTVLLAGPCFEPTFGLIILETADQEEATRIMEREPSVVGRVHTYEIQPMRVAIRASGVKEG
jgi:uncharacterized protein YciI